MTTVHLFNFQAADFKADSLSKTIDNLVKEKSTLISKLQAFEKELAESKV